MSWIDNIKGKVIKKNSFNDFTIDEILLEYDFPLLVLAVSPDKKKWLFKWCDVTETDNETEIWMAFKISSDRLSLLKENKISLREVITLSPHPLYLIESSGLFDISRMKVTYPENVPADYLPSDDISLNGSKLNSEYAKKFQTNLHVFSDDIVEGEAPLAIISPLQEKLQQYIRWAAHYINNSISKDIFYLKDWTTLKLLSVSPGSFKMKLTNHSSTEESINLSKAYDSLSKMVDNKLDIESMKNQVGNEAFFLAYLLNEFISKQDLSISIRWLSSTDKGGYLVIDKRRAKKFLSTINLKNSIENVATITITLNGNEAEGIRKKIVSQGGLQSLLRKLQKKLTTNNTIDLTADEIEKIRRYAFHYGQGGYQGRIIPLALKLEKLSIAFQIL